jgi:uroporphyrinogen-III decarboxylase
MTVPRLESIKDVGKLKVPNPDEIPAVRRISRFAEYFLKHIRDRIPINIPVPIMPSTNAAMIRGETEFMYDLIDHPKEAKQLLEIAVETEVRVVKHFRELLGCSEPETIGLADDAVCYFSPQLYEEFAVPYERIAIEALSKTGKARSFHICGPSMHLLEIIKKHLDPQEMLISHLGNVTNASEVMPGTILRGNADPQVLKDGPRDKIRDHILECLSQGETCDLYCFASGTDSWYRDTPIENMHYAYAVIKEYEHQAGRHE